MNSLTYAEFVEKYESLLLRLMKYDPGTIGCSELSSELSDLVESYSEFEYRYDNEVNYVNHG